MKFYGSLNNRLLEGPAAVKPVVGMKATRLMYSDRIPVVVVEVSKSGHKIGVRQLDSYWDGSEPGPYSTESQEGHWVITDKQQGSVLYYTRRRNGSYRERGGVECLRLDVASRYLDPSF